MDQRTYLKVKIKSLAAEAKIIRRQEKKARDNSIREGLYLHRIGTVRREARHTLLAYCFLRGREYKQIEACAKEAPDWQKVRKMVEKYGTHIPIWAFRSESHQDYQKRVGEAKEHLADNLKRFDEWVAKATMCKENAS